MGESRISFAPEGASGTQFALLFYKHSTATRLSSERTWRHTLPFLLKKQMEFISFTDDEQKLSPRQSRQARGRGDRVKSQISGRKSQSHVGRTDGLETYAERLSRDLRDPAFVQAITQNQ